MRRSQFEKEQRQKQQNILIEGVTANERRFWDGLFSDRVRIGVLQAAGLGLIGLSVLAVFYSVFVIDVKDSDISGGYWRRLIGEQGGTILLLAIGAGVLMVGRMVSRARAKTRGGTSDRAKR